MRGWTCGPCGRRGVDTITYTGPVDGDSILLRIVSLNLHRRHLTTRQRAAMAAEVANLPHGGAPKKSEGSNDPSSEVSLDDAATMFNVSRKSVSRAKTRMQDAPEAHKAAKLGAKPPKREKPVKATTNAPFPWDRVRAALPKAGSTFFPVSEDTDAEDEFSDELKRFTEHVQEHFTFAMAGEELPKAPPPRRGTAKKRSTPRSKVKSTAAANGAAATSPAL